MNPKTPQDLDPKLKEAYDRVMGGNFSPTPPAKPNVEAQQTTPKQAPAPAQSFAAQPMPSSTPLSQPSPVFVPSVNVPSPSSSPVSQKKKMKLSPVIFLFVGLAFFAVYAVVWAKLFGLF
jgi:hypothetical protein